MVEKVNCLKQKFRNVWNQRHTSKGVIQFVLAKTTAPGADRSLHCGGGAVS